MNTQELAQFFKTLADPVRLQLLCCLLERDAICVCDLIDLLGLPQSVVSRHLAYLRRNRLVTSERRGTWQYYSHNLHAHQQQTLIKHFALATELKRLQEQLQHGTNNSCCA